MKSAFVVGIIEPEIGENKLHKELCSRCIENVQVTEKLGYLLNEQMIIKILNVELGNKSYPIYIGSNLLVSKILS